MPSDCCRGLNLSHEALDNKALLVQAMKNVLTIAAVAEAATGLALLIAPSFVAQALLGEGLNGAAPQIARVAGIALVALGIACWPGPPLLGMLTYGGAITLYLAYLGLSGAASGALLWPAVIFHVVLTALLLRSFVRPGHGFR